MYVRIFIYHYHTVGILFFFFFYFYVHYSAVRLKRSDIEYIPKSNVKCNFSNDYGASIYATLRKISLTRILASLSLSPSLSPSRHEAETMCATSSPRTKMSKTPRYPLAKLRISHNHSHAPLKHVDLEYMTLGLISRTSSLENLGLLDVSLRQYTTTRRKTHKHVFFSSLPSSTVYLQIVPYECPIDLGERARARNTVLLAGSRESPPGSIANSRGCIADVCAHVQSDTHIGRTSGRIFHRAFHRASVAASIVEMASSTCEKDQRDATGRPMGQRAHRVYL